MKKTLYLILIFICSLPLAAAEMTEHSLSMNLGGPAGIASFEYEYKFINMGKASMHFTAGVGSLVLGYSFPIGFTYTYGDENQLIIGAHYVPIYFAETNIVSSSSFVHAFSPRIGIRKIFKISREMAYLQAYLSPIFSPDINGVFAWGGIGFGVYL